MVKNLLIAVLIVAVIGMAVVAFTQFNAQQDAVARMQEAQTAQAQARAGQSTAAAQADAALSAQQTAEANQSAAVLQATNAAGTQATAEAERGTAVAQAESASDAQSVFQNDLATAQAQMTEQATAQGEGEARLATAQTLIAAQATDLAIVSRLLGTATAQVDVADFARAAAEEDRSAALTQVYAASTALAQANATIAGLLPASPTIPPRPTTSSPAAPTETPPVTAVTSATTPIVRATGTPLVIGAIVLDQTFTSADGAVSLRYPDGWLVQEEQGQIYVFNTPDVLNSSGSQLQPGQFVANILFGQAADLPGLTVDASAVEFLTVLIGAIAAQSPNAPEFGEPSAFTAGPYDVARVDGATANGHTLVIAVQLGNGLFAVAFGNSAVGELDQHEPAFRAILGTLMVAP